MVDLDPRRLRSLVSFAIVLGLGGGAFLYLTAPFWAALWGVASAADLIRWLAISATISPLYGLATGVLTRLGRFRKLAVIVLISNTVGMAVGLGAVVIWQSALSLIVSSVFAQVALLVGALGHTDRLLFGLGSLRGGDGDIGFSGKLTFASLLSYATGNIMKLSMARSIGPDSLGLFNRAEVLTVIPFQQLQSALLRAAYPEFRHDLKDSIRARVVWTDMLVMTAWAVIPASAIAAVVLPYLVPILFGPGWKGVSTLVGPLAVAGALQIVVILLASGIEALGRFRWVWSAEAIMIALQFSGGILIFIHRDIRIAVWMLLATLAARHIWQIFLAGRGGYLNVRHLSNQYFILAAVSGILGFSSWLLIRFFIGSTDFRGPVLITAASVSILIALTIKLRRRIPIFYLARKYGFI